MPPDNLPLLMPALLLDKRLDLRLGERTAAARDALAGRRVDQVHRCAAEPRAAGRAQVDRLERASVVQEIRKTDLVPLDEGPRLGFATPAVHRDAEHGRVLVAVRVVEGDHLGDLLFAHRAVRGPDRYHPPLAFAGILLERVRPGA